jgi:hypothetical protein
VRTPSQRPANLKLTLISRQLPKQNGEMAIRGKVGNEVTINNEIWTGGSDGPRQVRVGAR